MIWRFYEKGIIFLSRDAIEMSHDVGKIHVAIATAPHEYRETLRRHRSVVCKRLSIFPESLVIKLHMSLVRRL